MGFFIALHVGAGRISQKNEDAIASLMRRACTSAKDVLLRGGNSLDGAVSAVSVLEDDPLTNAGFGSNLSEDGEVEVDASVTNGERQGFAAVGSVPGRVQNPVALAAALLHHANRGPLQPLSRVPPRVLVGHGALRWAVRHNVALSIGEDGLRSPAATQRWKRYQSMARAQAAEATNGAAVQPPSKRARLAPDTAGARDGREEPVAAATSASASSAVNDGAEATESATATATATAGEGATSADDCVHDTVGAICVDSSGVVSAAASSGGIAFKTPGRVGLAALPGHGCWSRSGNRTASGSGSDSGSGFCADAATVDARYGVGCCMSGAGEETMSLSLAERIAQSSCRSAERHTGSAESRAGVLKQAAQWGLDQLSRGTHGGGFLLVQTPPASDACSGADVCGKVALICAHSTPAMGFAFMSSSDVVPVAMVQRHNATGSDRDSTLHNSGGTISHHEVECELCS